MIIENNPEINVDEIMAKIRAEIANRKTIAPQGATGIPAGNFVRRTLSIVWEQVASDLSVAGQNTDYVNRQLQMAQYPKLLRWLARLSGLAFMYLARIFTIPQREYNLALVRAVEQVASGLKSMEGFLINQTERIAASEGQLVEKGHQISNLETQLSSLQSQFKEIQ